MSRPGAAVHSAVGVVAPSELGATIDANAFERVGNDANADSSANASADASANVGAKASANEKAWDGKRKRQSACIPLCMFQVALSQALIREHSVLLGDGAMQCAFATSAWHLSGSRVELCPNRCDPPGHRLYQFYLDVTVACCVYEPMPSSPPPSCIMTPSSLRWCDRIPVQAPARLTNSPFADGASCGAPCVSSRRYRSTILHRTGSRRRSLPQPRGVLIAGKLTRVCGHGHKQG
jgi:hypothetical protein